MSGTRRGEEIDNCGYVEVDPTGRYGRFQDVLGRGAMKTVYSAFDELNGIEVAWNQTKICDVLRSREALERLYSEVHLLSTLGHDSIMQFHSSWVDSKKRTFNFITEMFTSGSLREYRQKHKRVDIRAVKNWAREILHGLVYLHGHDPPVIHRDLKCDNIFVNGNLGQVKIGDLGLAAVLQHSQPAHSVIGTPEFMAPELYDEEYNELVDIYSFGMCVLEMLTAEYPYSECSNPAQIYKKVTLGKLPGAFYKIQDREAQRFIGRCLEKASTRCSADELLLDPFLQVEDVDTTSTFHGKIFNVGSGSTSPRSQVDHQHLKVMTNAEMKITGKLNPDDAIFLRVHFSNKDGHASNIYFPFDIINDTPIDVANEMVKELEITYCDPCQIAKLIDTEISALVPDWKLRKHMDGHDHTDGYSDDEEGSSHHHFYMSSSTSSQSSWSSQVQSYGNTHDNHNFAHHAQDWLQNHGMLFTKDDDDGTSSESSIQSDKFSYVDCNVRSELEPTQSPRRCDPQSLSHNQKASRFGPEDKNNNNQLTNKFLNQCALSSDPSQPSSCNGVRRSSSNKTFVRNQSLVDIRSQLLHRTLVEEVNKRLFKTVGTLEDIGFQHPCESSSGKVKKLSSKACWHQELGVDMEQYQVIIP